jgi:4-amino-4-deoxy-L-arabinose transferase-like glycosyltransferase
VTQRAVQRLPRLALLLLCAAYVLPGVFGRDPWKNADVTAFGYMTSLLRGEASWLHPTIAGWGSTEGGVLPYWIGAAFMKGLAPWIDPALAARLPFALLLTATLALVWYATLHLARTEAAQPVAFAFGGEAHPVDYARAMADGAMLALMASLGLLQLGHETTPELVQLAATALLLYALAASPYRIGASRTAALVALASLAASGAATTGLLMGLGGALVCGRSSYAESRKLVPWLLAACALAGTIGTLLDAWVWRVIPSPDWLGLPKLLVWFTWPVWPLAAWTLWRWRRQLLKRHLSIPLVLVLVALLVSASMGASDRALMLALPALAVLGAFALPTLQRSVSAALDWFSVFFFTVSALCIWVIYVAMHTGVPAQPAANVARLAPEFVPRFSPLALGIALAGTVAWLALVRWRTGHHRHALWKSLVLPAGGVALSWLLLMTLWLPLLDHARSYRPLVQRLATHLPANGCVATQNVSRSQLAALEVHGTWRLSLDPRTTDCAWLLLGHREHLNTPEARQETPVVPGWTLVARERRPADRDEVMLVYRRNP